MSDRTEFRFLIGFPSSGGELPGESRCQPLAHFRWHCIWLYLRQLVIFIRQSPIGENRRKRRYRWINALIHSTYTNKTPTFVTHDRVSSRGALRPRKLIIVLTHLKSIFRLALHHHERGLTYTLWYSLVMLCDYVQCNLRYLFVFLKYVLSNTSNTSWESWIFKFRDYQKCYLFKRSSCNGAWINSV